MRSYGKLLWRFCVLWPRLASCGPGVLRVCVRVSRNLIRSDSKARGGDGGGGTAAAARRRKAQGGDGGGDVGGAAATEGASSPPSAAERGRKLVREAVTYWLPGWRESITYWLVRPAMRLSALVVERTAQTLPAGRGLSARSAGSDGLVDTGAARRYRTRDLLAAGLLGMLLIPKLMPRV